MTIVGNFLFLDKVMKFTLELHLFNGSPCFTVLFSHHHHPDLVPIIATCDFEHCC